MPKNTISERSNGRFRSAAIFGVSYALGLALGTHSASNSQGRVVDIQSHNRQIEQQLHSTYKGMGNLVLNDNEDTFVFTIHSEDQPVQTCTGEYDVTKQTAQAVGVVACVQKLAISDK